jgi:uncharacterized protein YbaR (Trm112 family)
MDETVPLNVTGPGRGPYSSDSLSTMNLPPILEDWRTDWHLAARLDQLAASDAADVTVAGILLHIRYEESALIARSDERAYPVMVVDDEIFVLLGDGSD